MAEARARRPGPTERPRLLMPLRGDFGDINRCSAAPAAGAISIPAPLCFTIGRRGGDPDRAEPGADATSGRCPVFAEGRRPSQRALGPETPLDRRNPNAPAKVHAPPQAPRHRRQIAGPRELPARCQPLARPAYHDLRRRQSHSDSRVGQGLPAARRRHCRADLVQRRRARVGANVLPARFTTITGRDPAS